MSDKTIPRFPLGSIISRDEAALLPTVRRLEAVLGRLADRALELRKENIEDELLASGAGHLTVAGACLGMGPLLSGTLVVHPGRAYWKVRELIGVAECDALRNYLDDTEREALDEALRLDALLRQGVQ